MGIELSDEEVWSFLEHGHTGILTTLRRDGRPVALPLWYVLLDRTIYCATPARSRKVARIRRDSRAAFLVESGRRWTELKAVALDGRVVVVSGAEETGRVQEAMDRKYERFRLPTARAPEATQKHYSSTATLRFEPSPCILSWDNAKIRLKG